MKEMENVKENPPMLFSQYENSTNFLIALFENTEKFGLQMDIYYSNNCSDSRVQEIFGSNPKSWDAQYDCQDLAYDFGETYGEYVPNEWYCGHNGKISVKKNEQGYIAPECQCNPGYIGQTCMFSEEPYKNAFLWIDTMQEWVNNYIKYNELNNKMVLFDLIEMCMGLFMVSTNSKAEDAKRLEPFISNFSNSIINANITMDNDLQERIYELMDYIMLKIDSSLSGVDPTEMLAMSDADFKSSQSYNLQNAKIDPEKDMKLDPKNPTETNFEANSTYNYNDLNNGNFTDYSDYEYKGNITPENTTTTIGNNRRILIERRISRILNEAKASKSQKKTYNADSSTVIIPQAATSKLYPATVTFVQTKDPKSMQQSDSVKIQSFIINIKAGDKTNRTLKKYPEGVNPMLLRVPWALPPLVVSNYQKSCRVYSFDGKTWSDASKKCIINSKSDSKAAMFVCKSSDTYGVSCTPGSAKREVQKTTMNYGIFRLFHCMARLCNGISDFLTANCFYFYNLSTPKQFQLNLMFDFYE